MSCLTWVVSPATGFDLQPQTRTRSTLPSVRLDARNVPGARFALLAWEILLCRGWETALGATTLEAPGEETRCRSARTPGTPLAPVSGGRWPHPWCRA